jgi:hypothetical protein
MIVVASCAAAHRTQRNDRACFRCAVDHHYHQAPMVVDDVDWDDEHVELEVGDEFLLRQRLTDAAVRVARQLQPQLRVEDEHLLSSMMCVQQILEEEVKESVVEECRRSETMELVEMEWMAVKVEAFGSRKSDDVGRAGCR